VETVQLKKVTIVAEAILEERLTTDLKQLGAAGFTITAARGEGSRGLRTIDWENQNIRLETIVAEAVANDILAHIASTYFAHFAIIVWLTEVAVVRGEKYIKG
jgi:nitrogen regulatory protein P-II 2